MALNSRYTRLWFDSGDDTNFGTTKDFLPKVSEDIVDHVVYVAEELAKGLGVTDLERKANGGILETEKWEVEIAEEQVEEGKQIKLSKVRRMEGDTYQMKTEKYTRKESIESVDSETAAVVITKGDNKFAEGLAKIITKRWFDMLNNASHTAGATGTGLQSALANAWASAIDYYKDTNVNDFVFFCNQHDVANYLADHSITTETAFGLRYLEDFMGIGRLIVSPEIPKGTVYCTAQENIRGAYVGQGSDIANVFGLTFDQVYGMVGMKHYLIDDEGVVGTLMILNILFYLFDQSGVIKATITG